MLQWLTSCRAREKLSISLKWKRDSLSFYHRELVNLNVQITAHATTRLSLGSVFFFLFIVRCFQFQLDGLSGSGVFRALTEEIFAMPHYRKFLNASKNPSVQNTPWPNVCNVLKVNARLLHSEIISLALLFSIFFIFQCQRN